MPRTCAYCGSGGPFTKDHVWPACFLERLGRRAAHFSHTAQKAHGADYVVGDVCADCNNRRLSPLDAYFCQAYDRFFSETHGFGADVVFEYDFEPLSRVLIKIAYNSARGVKADLSPFQGVIRYVREGGEVPIQLALCLELISPSIIEDEAAPDGKALLLPRGVYRSAVTQLLSPHGDFLHTRIVAVNSYYFHLVLPANGVSDEVFSQASAELPQYIKGVIVLPAGRSSVVVRTSPQHMLSSLAPHLEKYQATYDEFFKSKKVK